MICNLILAKSPTATQCSFHVTGAVKCAESFNKCVHCLILIFTVSIGNETLTRSLC